MATNQNEYIVICIFFICLVEDYCHCNQSAYATAIKKIAEANAMNISAKFQLYPPYSFWGVGFEYFLQI